MAPRAMVSVSANRRSVRRSVVAHAMFGETLVMVSGRERNGLAQMFSEFVATSAF